MYFDRYVWRNKLKHMEEANSSALGIYKEKPRKWFKNWGPYCDLDKLSKEQVLLS